MCILLGTVYRYRKYLLQMRWCLFRYCKTCQLWDLLFMIFKIATRVHIIVYWRQTFILRVIKISELSQYTTITLWYLYNVCWPRRNTHYYLFYQALKSWAKLNETPDISMNKARSNNSMCFKKLFCYSKISNQQLVAEETLDKIP